ncbi:MAG: saccharopine dehydrogenase family protein [Cellvibrionaceae bacterium]|nr:saccharopine dehydrogenase family protein [Cellvibrionaceae bacterium]
MKKVMIIGAGSVSRVVAHKCAQLPHIFSDIILASRTETKCIAIAEQVQKKYGKKIITATVDADNVPELTSLIDKHQPFLIINVALPYQDLSIMDACLETGVHYLDTANYEPLDSAKFEYKWQWAYQQKFEQAGLMALLGSGFDPGATNMFTAYAAKHYFDEIQYLDIIDINGGDHGYPFATNFNPEINIREVTAECRHWEDGKFVSSPALSKSQSFTCPGAVGTYKIYRIYHEELESLSKHYPSLRRAQFWMSFTDSYLNHLDVLGNVGMTRIDAIEYQGKKIVPIQFLKHLLPDPATLGSRTQGKVCIGCVVRGIKNGQEKTVYIYTIKDHQACYQEVNSQAIAYTTGVPAMIGAKLMIEGTYLAPGVWNMEQLDPDAFMDDMNRYGLPFKVLEAPDFDVA